MIILGTIVFILVCLFAFYYFCIRPRKTHDEKTNRFYRYAKKSDNPKRALCPKCVKEYKHSPLGVALRPLIHSVYGDKKYHGVYCWFHGEVWFDKEDL